MERFYSEGSRLFACLAFALLVLGTLAAPGPSLFANDPGGGDPNLTYCTSCPNPISNPCPSYNQPNCSNGLCVIPNCVCECKPRSSTLCICPN
jgi:hypothetical protein